VRQLIAAAAETDRFEVRVGALPAAVRDLVEAERPDAIYHLAAVAYGPDAASDLGTAIGITVGGTGNLLEAARALDPPPTVLVPGSSEVYGTPDETPITEAAALRPVNLYGATKVSQESIALTFGHVHDVPVVVTRSFNHIGPGQRAAFAVASFARQLHQIEIGRSAPTLRVGNLAPVRDFSDVRDVVRAYRLLVAGGHAGQPINVASGRGVSIGELVESLITASGLEVRVEVDPGRVRRGEAQRIVGDNTRLRTLTGWAPEIPLAQTLADIWADVRGEADGVLA
jgi:GDP-4-dehydro-6-deoxy-D-mannose reductase